MDFIEWNPGEPNDWPPGEDCAKVFLETGGWNDIPCWWPCGYVCKKLLTGKCNNLVLCFTVENLHSVQNESTLHFGFLFVGYISCSWVCIQYTCSWVCILYGSYLQLLGKHSCPCLSSKYFFFFLFFLEFLPFYNFFLCFLWNFSRDPLSYSTLCLYNPYVYHFSSVSSYSLFYLPTCPLLLLLLLFLLFLFLFLLLLLLHHYHHYHHHFLLRPICSCYGSRSSPSSFPPHTSSGADPGMGRFGPGPPFDNWIMQIQPILGPYQPIFPQFRHSAPSFCKTWVQPCFFPCCEPHTSRFLPTSR